MTIGELYYGSAKSPSPERNNSLIEEFLLTVEIIQMDISISKRFGYLKVTLQTRGIALPDADIFIAATAYEKADLLVSGNTAHFERFPDLSVENWIR